MSFDLKLKGGDFVINNGDLKTVVDSEKLIQDILKICLTDAGSNKMHPWYGSFLSKSLIGNANSNQMLVQIGKSQLDTALKNLKDLQGAQIRSYQRVSADEQIASVQNVEIYQDQIDPRLYNVHITVISKGMKPITTAFRVSTI